MVLNQATYMHIFNFWSSSNAVINHKHPAIPFQEVAERRVCLQGRGDEETELEFDEEFVAGSDIQRFRRQVNTLIRTNHKLSISKAQYET